MIGKKINQLATELAPVSTDLTIIGDPTTGVSKKITLAQLGAIFSGAVSFYTNLAGFPAVGDINVIYCAKDTQKLYLWSGSAYVEVFPSQALLDTYQLRSEKGNANGYASLDSQGKVPISQLPSSIMEYKGTWNASTNTPTLANGTGDTGDVYICNVAGTVNFGAGAITFAVGDYVIYSGTIWQRSSGAVGTVTSVAVSRSGDALAITGSPVTTSGTINIGFAGTGAQYIKGDGTLATFPNTIDQAKNLITEVYNSTGATLTKGTVVYINGGQGNLPTVTKALASGDSTSAQTYGIVQADITNNNNGFVVVAGRLADIDTSAFSVGTQLYLSSTTAGAYTSTKQYAPAHLVYVGIIVRSHPTQGIIEVKIQNGYELDELHNVAAQTPTNNDGLFWEASTSLWKNKSIATILGGTPVTGSGNVNAIPKFTANSVLGNSVMEDDGNFVSMRGLKLNETAGFGNTINFQQSSSITAAGLDYSSIGASGSTGFVFYVDQNTTSRSFILDTSTITSATQLTYSLPASSGTLALVSQLTGGTVTSVGLSSATSGVTIGSTPITTSGTITLAIATASGSQQGLLSSTDWTTFNNKQNALTNPVTGTGTTNYLPKFTGTSTIGNSQIYDNGTSVGIGTATPYSATNYKFLTIDGTNGSGYVTRVGSINSFLSYSNSAGTTLSEQRALPIVFETTGTSRMTLDASGNLGLGVTPSAWGSSSKSIEFTAGSIESRSTAFSIWANGYYDGSSSKYVANGFASNYYQFQGQHIWLNAPSGTAGNAISFTQAMTLNASGNLSLGNTNDTYKLDVSGTGRFTGNVTVGSGIGLSQLTVGNGAGYTGIVLSNGSSIYSWLLGSQYNINNGFEITPSTTIGGSTFTTPVFKILNTGAATFSSTITQLGEQLLVSNAGSPNIQLRKSGVTDWGSMTYTGSLLQLGTFAGGQTLNITTGGNVGIGTTSPIDKLHIVGGITSTSLATPSNTSIGSLQIGYDGTNGVIRTWNSSPLITSTYNYQAFETSGSERMRIKSNGIINLSNVPSSSAGLSSGDIYKTVAGVLMIV
jgi:hypothetical protein